MVDKLAKTVLKNVDRITSLEINQKASMEIIKRIDDRTEQLDHVIRGNGNPGLKADMVLLKQQCTDIKIALDQSTTDRKKVEEKRSDHNWQLWVAIIVMLGTEILHWSLKH